MNTGLSDLRSHGGQCKEWVRDIVKRASKNAGGPQRNIPPNKPRPRDYAWINDPNMSWVIGLSAPIQNVSAGWILQLRMFNGTPHTFIVSDITSTHVKMLDSNWSSNNDEIVRNHDMSFTTFKKTFKNWSCYFIQ